MRSDMTVPALPRPRTRVGGAIVAALGCGAWLLAATVLAGPAASGESSENAYQSDPFIKASYLSGKQVENRRGEIIGIVKDMLLDIKRNRIQYVVLSIGGILGVGDKLVAVPVRALHILTERDAVMLDADSKQINQAPALGDGNWPQRPDFSVFGAKAAAAPVRNR